MLPSDEPVFHVKLLAALRSGDPALILPFLAEIGKDRRISETCSEVDTGAAALHLAIRCASAETVALLLSHRAIAPNGVHPPGSGTTALHLAASLGRTDIVNLLLDLPLIDDSLRDAQGRTCRDVAKSKDVARAIDDSRSLLNATFRSELHNYILSPLSTPPAVQYKSPPGLAALLEQPRAKFIDLAYLDEDSGTSLLHEAARRKDLRLIELAVRAGADVFVRNKKGKTAYEGTGKDDQVRVFLRQYANHDNTLIHTSTGFHQLPTLKGYLNKYTNVAKGYNTRWFVLRGGIMSYYRNQADETVASRGSISMKNAILKPSHDKLRFEVHSIPARASSSYQDPSSGSTSTSIAHAAGNSGGGQKWYLKANHPVEAARWMQAIERSIQYFTREKEKEVRSISLGSPDKEGMGRRKSGESDSSFLQPGQGTGTLSSFPGASLLKKAARSGGSMVREVRDKASLSKGDVSVKSFPPAGEHGHVSKGSISTNAAEMVHSFGPTSNSLFGDEDRDEGNGNGYGAEDETEDNNSSSGDSLSQNAKGPPYEPSFVLQANSVMAQLELTAQLVAGVSSGPPSQTSSFPSSSSSLASSTSIQQKQQQLLQTTLTESFTSLASLVQDYIKMVNEREKWFCRRLGEERGRQRVWEESLKVVVKEGEDLEKELRARSRRRGSAFAGVGVVARPTIGSILWDDKRHHEQVLEGVGEVTTVAEATALMKEEMPSLLPPLQLEEEEQQETGLSPITRSPAVRSLPLTKLSRRSSITSSIGTTDEEDEFFDAIETNNLPNLVVHSSFTPSRPSAPFPPIDFACYSGYNQLRTTLGLSADDRPSTSLWSVLKHSIGKDLTRISFPVFFNEPTSMLQRMAEDMEFSECLDAAARESDPLRRIAYVAAFAMSNYSSTIGRIAKPFNPMLSETFEYARLDKQYRYMSEQVSHHPPISACWAESPLWYYYGEVDAQNKFMGKSFEIRPTGIAHVELVLPESLGSSYPKAPEAKSGPGKVKEHYTWKKVTTNVSGFILGSPTIDHYGDMVVTNHRTGDQCILTFKPRGWRGKDAYEITGQVMDAEGNIAYDIAGRWNSQLVARRRGYGGSSDGALNPDTFVHAPPITNGPGAKPEFVLLWRNSERPPGMPFNLTPFAITLNDCPRDSLLPYLAPTDCRLRPDQRAFELGKYELANTLKMMQEEKQRTIRRAREEGRVPPHRPRWFIAQKDEDTGERVWNPVRVGATPEYWVERERVFREGGGVWKNVENIFIEEPESIKGW